MQAFAALKSIQGAIRTFQRELEIGVENLGNRIPFEVGLWDWP